MDAVNPSYEVSRADLAYLAAMVKHICIDAHKAMGLPEPVIEAIEPYGDDAKLEPRYPVVFTYPNGRAVQMKAFEWYIYSKLILPDKKRAIKIAVFLSNYI